MKERLKIKSKQNVSKKEILSLTVTFNHAESLQMILRDLPVNPVLWLT
jgi:hypothetical protein